MKKKTIRQSKRLIISLFVTFFCLTASAAQAQTALVTIDLQQVKMVQVMDEIENQTKYLSMCMLISVLLLRLLIRW